MLALLSRESEPHFQHHATLLDFFLDFRLTERGLPSNSIHYPH